MGEFSHFDQHGNAVMVDVTEKKKQQELRSHRERSKSMMKSLRKSKKEVWQKGMSWEPQGSLGSWRKENL